MIPISYRVRRSNLNLRTGPSIIGATYPGISSRVPEGIIPDWGRCPSPSHPTRRGRSWDDGRAAAPQACGSGLELEGRAGLERALGAPCVRGLNVALRLALVLLGFMVAGSVTVGCGGGVGDPCDGDSECADDLGCAGPDDKPVCGIPARRDCQRDADCGEGNACHAVADPCSANGIGSECRPTCEPGGCGAPFECLDGACRPVLCGDAFACLSHRRCDLTSVEGELPVWERDHGCVDIACSSAGECPDDTFCVNGVCQRGRGVCTETMIVP